MDRDDYIDSGAEARDIWLEGVIEHACDELDPTSAIADEHDGPEGWLRANYPTLTGAEVTHCAICIRDTFTDRSEPMKTRTQPGEEWPVPRGHDKPSRARWCDEMTPVGTDADAWLARAGEELLEAAEMLQDFAEYAERMRQDGRGFAPVSASGFEAPDLARGLLAVRWALEKVADMRMVLPANAKPWRCSECGGEKLSQNVRVHLNTGEIDWHGERTWCAECDAEMWPEQAD